MSESRLDLMMQEAFAEQQAREQELERRRRDQHDPFKKPRREPGRAVPGHGAKRPTSLGGAHS